MVRETYRDSQGEQTNPSTATVLADTGAIPFGGIYRVLVSVGASAAAKMAVQQRDAANGATVGDVMPFYVEANATQQIEFQMDLAKDERVRVLPLANLTGTAVAAISATRVG